MNWLRSKSSPRSESPRKGTRGEDSDHHRPHLHQQVHDVSRHLLDEDLDDPEDLSLGTGQRGGVDVLLGLRVGRQRRVPVHLWAAGTVTLG